MRTATTAPARATADELLELATAFGVRGPPGRDRVAQPTTEHPDD